MLWRLLPLTAVVVLAAGLIPASATASPLSPAGALDTNPLGSLSWAPANANNLPSDEGVYRLTIEYDHSIDGEGNATELLANGGFGVRLFTTALTNTNREAYPVKVADHSPHVSSIDDSYGAPQEADEVFAGFSGDVRDGDCDKLGTEEFSAAFSTSATVTDSSPDYEPGPCQTVDATTDNGDGTFTHLVTTHRPGFWVDVQWSAEIDGLGSENPGRTLAEIWYGTLYDTDAEDGEWFETADSAANSTSTHEPGRYIANEELTAPVPEPLQSQCVEAFVPDAPNVPDSYDEITVDIPEGVTRAVFQLHPYGGDWDLLVTAPDESATESGNGPPHAETVALSSPEAGTYTVRGCNFAGPPVAKVTVAVEG